MSRGDQSVYTANLLNIAGLSNLNINFFQPKVQQNINALQISQLNQYQINRIQQINQAQQIKQVQQVSQLNNLQLNQLHQIQTINQLNTLIINKNPKSLELSNEKNILYLINLTFTIIENVGFLQINKEYKSKK